MKKWTCTIFLLVIALFSFAQNRISYKQILTSNTNYHNVNIEGQNLFKLLATNTNAGINRLSLDVKYRISAINTKSGISIGLNKIDLKSSFFIRDFKIDNKLWPNQLTANISSKGKTLQVKVNTDGTMTTIYGKRLVFNKKTTFIPSEFIYDSIVLENVSTFINEINEYHSLSKLLLTFENHQKVLSGQPNLPASVIFIDKIATIRINNLINKYTIVKNIDNNQDPLNLKSHLTKYNRYSVRISTLYKNELLNLISDTEYNEFCKLYTKLSTAKLDALENIQPDDGIAIREASMVIDNELPILNSIAQYYKHNQNIDRTSFYYCLYHEMALAAKKTLKTGNNNNALLLLTNAVKVGEYGNIVFPMETNVILLDIMEELITSQLRVGLMSLKAGNSSLAFNYFSHCDTMIDKHLKNITSINIPDTSYIQFIETQSEILKHFTESSDWENATKTLGREINLCNIVSGHTICESVETHRNYLFNHHFAWQIEHFANRIHEKQFPDAYDTFANLTSSYYKYEEYLSADNKQDFYNLSNELYEEYIKQSNILINAGHPFIALEQLLKAKTIQPYLLTSKSTADSLILQAAKPSIFDIISDAEFHVWANRLDQATDLKIKADSMFVVYFDSNNESIKVAIDDLETKISNRECMTYKIKLNDIISTINISLKNKNYKRCYTLFTEANSLISSTSYCNIDTLDYHKLALDNYYFIKYFFELDELTNLLYSRGYSQVIPAYINLQHLYNKHIANKYDISFIEIETFIKEQNLLSLTRETIKYYDDIDNPIAAISYIDIYRQQGGNSRDIKKLITNTAQKLALIDEQKNIPSGEAIKTYTNNGSWYLNFRISYLKNRVL